MGRNVVPLLMHSSICLWQIFVLFKSLELEKTLDPKSPIIRQKKEYGPFFFTVWNYAFQVIFISICLFEDALYVFHSLKSWDINEKIGKIRAHFFTAIVFPCCFVILYSFWPLYFYDRELIYEEELDEFIPFWHNLSMHFFIIIIPFSEIFLLRRSNIDVNFTKALKSLIILIVLYFVAYYYVYFRYKFSLYPITQRLTFFQGILYCLYLSAGIIAWCYVGCYLQKVMVNKKEPVKK